MSSARPSGRSEPASENVCPLVLPDERAWRAWLHEHEHTCDGIWLTLAKKGVTAPTSLTYAQALDEALCSGWIDGQSKTIDTATYRQRFTPRRQRSLWSARNVTHVARLIDQRRVRPRGLAEIARVKADGRWDAAYAGPATIEAPDDLTAALNTNTPAQKTFQGLNAQNRYAILHRVITARTPQTRQRRIDRMIDMLARGETPHPQ